MQLSMRGVMEGDVQFSLLTWGVIASVIWVVFGANAGMHLAVAPATLAYRTCVEIQQSDDRDCQANLHRDWPKYSGDRLYFAVVAGLVPLPIVWTIAYFAVRAPRKARLGPTWSAHHLQEH
jgi:hypothetical protein